MTYHQLTGYLFHSLSYVLILSLLFIKKNKIEYILVLFFIFGSVYLYDYRILGIISLQQVLLAILACTYIFNQTRFNDDKNVSYFKKRYITLFIYLSVITVVFHFFRFDYKVQGGLIQNELRSVVQIVQLGSVLLSSLVTLTIPSASAKRIFNYFVIAMIVLAIIGIFQELVFLVFNFDIFPMRKDHIDQLYGHTERVYGFVRITAGIGEPKQVAKYLNIALASFIFTPQLLYMEKYKYYFSLLLLMGVIFTFSSTGYIILASQLFLFVFIKFRKNTLLMSGLIIVLTVIMTTLFFESQFLFGKIKYLISIGEIPFLEITDSTAVYFLVNNPIYILLGVGIGNVVAFAYPYVTYAKSIYINSSPYTLRRGIVKDLVQGGIVGSILVNSVFLSFARKTNIIEIKHLIIFFIFFYNFLTVEALNEFFMIYVSLLFVIGLPTKRTEIVS